MEIVSGIFLILYGALSTIFGLLNRNRSFWISIQYDGTEKWLEKTIRELPIFSGV